ncbi:MAG: AAA family ATPase [Candidatus Micrarchaeaceae archaeon]
MKLIELEIHNIRGIRHLLLKPDGRSLVILGPNGSGKSTVVDAVDFLLTGRISRLTGKGTGGITLSRYGHHIDCKPEEAFVRAVICLPGVQEPVKIERCIAAPSRLKCEESTLPQLEPVITLAQRGHHVLTRREILKYITADAKTRAQEIQTLLNITEIESIRQALVKARNDLGKEVQSAQREVNMAQGRVNATVQLKTFSGSAILQVINQNRAVLGGGPISVLHSTELKSDLRPPVIVVGPQEVNIAILQRDVQNLISVDLPESKERVAQSDVALRNLLEEVRSKPEILRALALANLTELGLKLIDETGRCPLCETEWPSGELQKFLQDRLSKAKIAENLRRQIGEVSKSIADSVNATIASLEKVIAVAKLAGASESIPPLRLWREKLEDLREILADPMERYPGHFSPDEVRRLLLPGDIPKILSRLESLVRDKYPEATPEQVAWDTLTRLEENLGALENAEDRLQKAQLSLRRAELLQESFLASRDTILGHLYDDIKEKFADLYRQLHGIDEGQFVASIKPDRAGLNFEVDFYGRGTHPPHALHSEGHQDSMGLCLYLALSERLTRGLIDLVILDDVVMSIDAEHRRDLCHLLAKSFPLRQFLITTHDKTWARQLQSEGVVQSKDVVELYNWRIDIGPQVNYETDIWQRLETDLSKGDIPSAAARLRRWAEEFFGMVCDSLQAKVMYKASGRWELGDFLPAAMGRYRELLKKAKDATRSWGDQEAYDSLQELDSTVGPIYTRSNAEQWAINANVHYNNWANFGERDFRPVVEAFQDLYGLFICSNCGGILHLVTKGGTSVGVRCNCGQVNWNLVSKRDSTK